MTFSSSGLYGMTDIPQSCSNTPVTINTAVSLPSISTSLCTCSPAERA
jgi:hypothetical protein